MKIIRKKIKFRFNDSKLFRFKPCMNYETHGKDFGSLKQNIYVYMELFNNTVAY